MGFFDKVTKAVGDVVDKGKREADQFMRIQKIKGEIGEIERRIAGFTAEIAQIKADAGAKAIALLRAGHLGAAELQPMSDRMAELEGKIETDRAVMAARRADIEKIKAEDDQPAASAAAAAPPVAAPVVAPPAPASIVPPPPAAVPVPPPPLDEAATMVPPPLPEEPKP